MTPELHWIEDEDERGFKVWLRYVACGHWGLILTDTLPHWILPHSWEQGIAQIRIIS